MLEDIFNNCKYLLQNSPQAEDCKNYLKSRVGNLDKFEFGFFPSTNQISLLTDLIDLNHLEEHNLVINKLIEDSLGPRTFLTSYFENHNLIMPYKNTYGEIVAFVGRSILDKVQLTSKKIYKYKNTQETKKFKKSNLLFGLHENKKNILEKNSVFIVEGQFDVIKATEKQFNNIVALGTSSMTAQQFALITRYTNNIFLLLDNDEAGEKGRKKIINNFSSYCNIQNVYLPTQYNDIDDYFSKCDDINIPFIIR